MLMSFADLLIFAVASVRQSKYSLKSGVSMTFFCTEDPFELQVCRGVDGYCEVWALVDVVCKVLLVEGCCNGGAAERLLKSL